MSDEEKRQEEQQEEQFEGLIDIIPKMFKGEYQPAPSTNDDSCSGVRGFILGLGDGMVNAAAILLLIALVIVSFKTMFTVDFLQGIAVLLIGLVILTIIFYTIYCIIEARYNLKKIADNTTKLIELKEKEFKKGEN